MYLIFLFSFFFFFMSSSRFSCSKFSFFVLEPWVEHFFFFFSFPTCCLSFFFYINTKKMSLRAWGIFLFVCLRFLHTHFHLLRGFFFHFSFSFFLFIFFEVFFIVVFSLFFFSFIFGQLHRGEPGLFFCARRPIRFFFLSFFTGKIFLNIFFIY